MSLTPDQHDEKRKYIGGSDAAIMFTEGGLYGKTKMDIYLRIVNGEEHFRDGPEDRTYWGSVLQGAILKAFEDARSCEVYRPESATYSSTHSYFGALLDGYLFEESAPIEAKNRSIDYWDRYGGCGGSLVPESDRIQLNWQMMVAGPACHHGYIAVLIGGNDFRWLKVERDQKLIDQMEEDGVNFWINHIEKSIPPEPECSSDCDKLWPKGSEKEGSIVATDEIECMAKTFAALSDTKVCTEESIDQVKTKIKAFMQDKTLLVSKTDDTILTWKNTKNGNRVFRPNKRWFIEEKNHDI